MITDNNYVDLMKEKDEEALRYFMEKDGWIVKNIIYKSNLLLQEDRMECLNDVFFAIWNNIRKYDATRSHFTTWVAGVTKYPIVSLSEMRNIFGRFCMNCCKHCENKLE